MIIRRIETAEYKIVVPLFNKYRVFYEQPSDLDRADRFIKERMENNESVIFVAFDGDDPVGFTQLYPSFSSVRTIRNYILNDLYVDEFNRKGGVGRSLINTAMVFARHQHARVLTLETAHDNYKAQKLYESMGFEKQAESGDFLKYSYTL